MEQDSTVDEDQKFFWETGLGMALTSPLPAGDQQAMTRTTLEERRLLVKRGGMNEWHNLIYQLRYRTLLDWQWIQRKT